MQDHKHTPSGKETVSARAIDLFVHRKKYQKEIEDYRCRCVHCGKLITYPKTSIILSSCIYVIIFLVARLFFLLNLISVDSWVVELVLTLLFFGAFLLLYGVVSYISLARRSWELVDAEGQGEGLAVLLHKEKQDKFKWRFGWILLIVFGTLFVLIEIYFRSRG